MINGFYCSGFVLQFEFVVGAISERFSMMNEKILSKCSLNSFQVDYAIEIYDKLFHAIKLINENLTVQLISTFGYSLIEILFSSYCIVREHVQDTSVKYFFSFPSVMWVLGQLFLLTTAIIASMSAMAAARNTKNVAYDALQNSAAVDARSRERLERFMNSIDQSKCQLQSAIFTIDWNLLLSVSQNFSMNES
jgi:hypothetical protein